MPETMMKINLGNQKTNGLKKTVVFSSGNNDTSINFQRLAPFMISIILVVSASGAGLDFADCVMPSQYIEQPNSVLLCPDSLKDWLLTAGENTEMKSEIKWTSPKHRSAEPVLKLSFLRKTPSLGSSEGSWFKLRREIADPLAWTEADGICVILAPDTPAAWWMAVDLLCEGVSFQQPLEPANYDKPAAFESRLLPFSGFKGKTGGGLNANDIGRLSSISLSGVAPDNKSLLVKKIFLYKIKKGVGLKFSTGKPRINIFEKGEAVEFLFEGSAGDMRPKSILVEVRDYFGRTVWRGVMSGAENEGKISFKGSPGELPAGYYDVEAWSANSKGEKLTPDSCVIGEGSLERGRGTFAVMPRSIAENNARRDKYGEKAFFGFHGKFLNLADLLGVSWRLGGHGDWSALEPQAPDRSSGMAPWARSLIDGSDKPPKRDFHIVNLGLNNRVPKWAFSDTPDKFPGIKDWGVFVSFLSDNIAVEKRLYPQMRRRLYDVAWEVDLNSPSVCAQKPVYGPEDVIELYRRAKAVVDAEDKDGILIGPCVSNISSDEWLSGIFKAGLAGYIRAFNMHGYHAPPPEKSKVAERIRALRALVRSFNGGHDMDIYCTELGYRSQYGMEDRHKEQAQWHVRAAAILKGEGLKVYYPFYSYDYKGDNSWGVCYNLDDKLSWGPKSVSPKAAVPALAVCIDQLEGADPVSELPYFGPDIYAYLFRKDGEPLLTLWSVEENHTVCLCVRPEGEKTSVPLEITDIMGGHPPGRIEDSCVFLEITPSILYVRGLSKRLYNEGVRADDIVGKTCPGENIRARILNPLSFTPGISVVNRKDEDAAISVAGNLLPGIYPLLDGGSVKWILVLDPVEICGVRPCVSGGKTGVELALRNKSSGDLPLGISVSGPNNQVQRKDLDIPAETVLKEFFPVETASPGKTFTVSIEVRHPGMQPLRTGRKVNFLAARKRGESGDGRLPNTISWKGKGSSGKTVSAKAVFEWDEKELHLNIEVGDDEFIQTRSDASIWMEDSLQIAFDTDPEKDDLYNPFAGIYSKKISELAFALSNNEQKMAWRHRTYDETQLKTGDVSAAFTMDFSRDDKSRRTRYVIGIPWRETGLPAELARPGKLIGIAILVNDKDSHGERAGIELFGGIMKSKDHSLYGGLLLE
jgi:hypothetical protein